MKKNIGLFGLFFSVLLLLCGTAGAGKTPQQAVSEMTWGANLSSLYMVGGYEDDTVGWDPNAVKTVGYVKNAPIGFAVTFWDNSFEWMSSYITLRPESFEISATLPNYNGNRYAWFDGMFDLAVLVNRESACSARFRLSNTRLVMANGTVRQLNSLNGEYTLTDFSEFNEYGSATCYLDISGRIGLTPSSSYNGAQLKATVTLISVPFTETGKVDLMFQYGRSKIDQYQLTDAYVDQGANVFRLPVTWTPFVDDVTFEIDRAWLDAVKTEVDYIVYEKNAYCILNMHDDYLLESFVGDHWETNWTASQYTDYVNRRFRAVWEQVADYFKDYPDRLIFETANEPVSGNMAEWYNGNEAYRQEQIDMVNTFNSSFVDAVRTSGGNNGERLLCLVTPGFERPDGLDEMYIPENDNYLIMTVHSYMEIEYTWNGKPSDPDWAYETPTNEYFATLTEFMNRTGIPVIIGETGVSHKETDAIRAERARYFYEKSNATGIPALWWDDYFKTDDGYYFWLYDIDEQEWGSNIDIIRAIQDAMDAEVGDELDGPAVYAQSDTVHPGDVLKVWITGTDASAASTRAYVVSSDNRTHMGFYEMQENNGKRRICVPVTENYVPGSYKLVVFSTAEDRVPGYTPVWFTVEEAGEELPDFEMSVSGTEITAGGQIHVQFTAAGASRLEVQVTRAGDAEWNDVLAAEGPRGEWDWQCDTEGVYTLTPVAYYAAEDENWDPVEEERRGEEQAAAVTVLAGIAFDSPESVTRGMLLPITVNGLGAGNADREIQLISWVSDENGEWVGECIAERNGVLTVPMTFCRPTGDLEPGTSYWVNVQVSAEGREDLVASHPVQVTEPESGAFVVDIQEDPVDQMIFTASAYEPDAVQMRMIVRNLDEPDWEPEEWGPFDGNAIRDYYCWLSGGRYSFTAVAYYANGDVRYSEAVVRTVGYTGETEEAVIRVPAAVRAGQDMTFRVDRLGQAGEDGYWEVRVHDTDDDWAEIVKWKRDEFDAAPVYFTVPGDLIRDGHGYLIAAWVDPAGTPGVSSDAYTQARADGGVLILPSGLQTIEREAFRKTSAQEIRIPDGVVTIGARAFADCDLLTDVWMTGSVRSIASTAFSGAVNCTIHAPSGSAAQTYAQQHGLGFEPAD